MQKGACQWEALYGCQKLCRWLSLMWNSWLLKKASCKLGLSTWTLRSSCPLPPAYGATQVGQRGRSLDQCVCPYSTCQFHREELLQQKLLSTHSNILFCDIVYIFLPNILMPWCAPVLAFPIFPWENTCFFLSRRIYFITELSHIKSTLISLRNNKICTLGDLKMQ